MNAQRKPLKVIEVGANSISEPTVKKVRAPKAPPGPLGVVDQVKQAFKAKNRLACLVGFLLGGFVPLASFVVAHYELDMNVSLFAQMSAYLVLGGLVYSARTCYDWGKLAFASGFKSAGWVVLLEGVMITSHSQWLSFLALSYLIVVNGVATGCRLSLRAN